MERYEQREQIKANIDYDYLRRQCPYDDVESLLELIVDVVSSTASTIRIGKEVLPAETVKRRFMQLDSSHIEYVIDSLKQTTTKINNIRAYAEGADGAALGRQHSKSATAPAPPTQTITKKRGICVSP